MRKEETKKNAKVNIALTDKFIDFAENLSTMEPELQRKVLDGMVDYYNGLNELGRFIEGRDDAHRLMGAEIVLNEFTDPKNNNFYMVLKILNKNAEQNTPTVKLSSESMPMWFLNDGSN